MRIYHNIDLFQPVPNPVVTVGTFDGVHLGHQQIFALMKEEAQRCGGETVVVTFYPHPRLVIHPDSKNLKFINTQEKKYEIIAKSQIDHLIIIPFTKEFSNLSSGEFVKRYLIEKIKMHKLIVGYDHHFGKDRLGGFNELKGLGKILGFELQEVPAMMVDGTPISSTKIRNALINGDIRLANCLLGYNYSISGKVVYGNRIGRTIGFPTANIQLEDEYKLISAVGVYACKVEHDGRIYKGMGNIGYRPTIDIGNLTIEVNIFDFDEEIYGDYITSYFIERIRDEKKFENLSALRDQLTVDRARVLEILSLPPAPPA
jgi:riboflavin kinase / FMN adenylyltransferase